MSSWKDEMTYLIAGAGSLVIIGVETKGRGLRVMLRGPTGRQHKHSMSAPHECSTDIKGRRD